MAVNKVGTIDDRVKVKTVLLSVFDKTGLDVLARGAARARTPASSSSPPAAPTLPSSRPSGHRRSAALRQVSDYTGPARDAGRAGEDARLQDLPRSALRDVQRRPRGGPGTDGRFGHRHGRRQPLPVRADRRAPPARHSKMPAPTSTSAGPAWCAPRRRTFTAWRCSPIPRTTPPCMDELDAAERHAEPGHALPSGAEGVSSHRAATTRPSPATWTTRPWPPQRGHLLHQERGLTRERTRTSRPPIGGSWTIIFPAGWRSASSARTGGRLSSTRRPPGSSTARKRACATGRTPARRRRCTAWSTATSCWAA